MISKPAHISDEELADPKAILAPVTFGPHQPGTNGAARPTPTHRTLPHSLEAEEYLLSVVLLDGAEMLDRCTAAKVRQLSFYEPRHGMIWAELLRMRAAGLPIDTATLAEELRDGGRLDEVGGFPFIAQVSSRVPTTAQASYFIQRVRDLAVQREIIRAASSTVEDAYAHTGDINVLTADLRRRLEFAFELSSPPATLARRGLDAFAVPPDDDASVLLGNRYLNRGDGMILVSSSGMGKSSFSLQAAVTWALGRPFFGIRPNGPLRSLIVQSEDSDGDIAEVWASICHKMNLTAEERETVGRNVVVVTDRIHRGESFLAELKRQVTAERFDLVWINPLAAFVGGDATTAEASADFLRTGLNALNEPPTFGYVVVHHTTKPATGKDRSERRWHEVMYDMAGSYDIIGWARSIMSVRPTETMGEFNVVLAKRGRRAGVTKKIPQGVGYRLESTIIIPARHSNETMRVPGLAREIPVIFWEPREEAGSSDVVPPAQMGRPKKNSVDDFMGIFPVGAQNALGVNELLREALKIRHIAKGTLYSIINEALEKRIIVCNSQDTKSPRYYVKGQSSEQSAL